MIRVQGDRVLVRPIRPVKAWVKAAAGDSPELQQLAQNLANPYGELDTMGRVVAMGSGARCPKCRRPHDAEYGVDDVLLFPDAAGQLIAIDGEDFILLRQADVLAVIT